MGKRLCSLLLVLSMIGSSAVALAADQTAGQIASTSTQDAGSQDPQAYREQHPQRVTQEETMSSVMLFANTTIKSIYTGNRYSVPAGANITQGIDVSKWDASINWTKVKAAGTDFAIIRVGYRGYGDGTLYADPTYTTNIKNANKAGVPVGVYFYSQAKTTAEAKAEAQYCIDKVQGYNIQLPIVMDLEFAENSSGYTGRLYNAKLSKSAQTKVCLAFCETVRAAGYTPMIYANAYMLREHTNASTLSATCPIWMASFPTSKTNVTNTTYTTSYTGDYDIWQYSEWGNVSGISPIIDCNFGINLTISGGTTGVTPVAAEGISLDNDAIKLVKGTSTTLGASVIPSDTTESISWKSSNTSIASVSNGKVTAVAAGTATITATVGSVSAKCAVTVTDVPAEQVTLSKSTLSLVKGKNSTLTATVAPTDTTDSLSWKSSNTSVATVSKGKVVAVAPGTATITATAGSQSATCTVTVKPAKPTMTTLRRTASGVVLYWNSSAGSKKYAIYRSTTGESGSYSKIATTTGKTYTDKKASSSKKYYYQVAGQATVSGSTYTSTRSTAINTSNIPARPTIKSLTQRTGRKARLTWSASKGAAQYYIFRSTTGKNGSFKKIKTVSGTSYTSGKLVKGKRYYYRIVPVRTINGILYRGRVSTTKNIRIR
ncbi:MAG: GH25 family lysozyme [Eubacteriales bacterium]|nr:GH25 family lysozyme [Eubacteriales bacterium]